MCWNYKKGTPKQFDNAGEIQILVDVCFFAFFPVALLQATSNWIIFSLLFVALSHCDKQNFGLRHWATATNRIFVCHTESLRQTKLVYVSKKIKKTTKKCPKKCKVRHKSPKKKPKRGQKCQKDKHCWQFLQLFGNKYNFCLSQWLRATNNFFVCCSDLVLQTQFLFVTVTQCNKQNWKKKF